MRTRQYKIVSIPESYFLYLLNVWYDESGFVHVPRLENLPEDAEVVAISANYQRQSIDAIVWSSEFESVPPSQIIPQFEGQFGFSWKALKIDLTNMAS